jgi:hypothetical protein
MGQPPPRTKLLSSRSTLQLAAVEIVVVVVDEEDVVEVGAKEAGVEAILPPTQQRQLEPARTVTSQVTKSSPATSSRVSRLLHAAQSFGRKDCVIGASCTVTR